MTNVKVMFLKQLNSLKNMLRMSFVSNLYALAVLLA